MRHHSRGRGRKVNVTCHLLCEFQGRLLTHGDGDNENCHFSVAKLPLFS